DDFGAEYVATAVTDDAGRFQLMCKGQPGACLGENRVVVNEGPLPDRLRSESAQAELARYRESLGGRPLPWQYLSLADTPLKVTVSAERKQYDLQLSR